MRHVIPERMHAVLVSDAVHGMPYPDLQPDFHDSVLPQVGHALPAEPVQTTFIHIHLPQNLARAPPQLGLSDAGECRSMVRSLEDEPRYASTGGFPE